MPFPIIPPLKADLNTILSEKAKLETSIGLLLEERLNEFAKLTGLTPSDVIVRVLQQEWIGPHTPPRVVVAQVSCPLTIGQFEIR